MGNNKVAFFVNAGQQAIVLKLANGGDFPPVYVQTPAGAAPLFATQVLGKAHAGDAGAPKVLRWEVGLDRFEARTSEAGNPYLVLDLTDMATLEAWLREVKPLVRDKADQTAVKTVFNAVFGTSRPVEDD